MLHRNLKRRQELGEQPKDQQDEPAQKRSKLPEAAGNQIKRRAAEMARAGISAALRVRESALFRPVKALAVVTDGIPLAHVLLGTQDLLVSSVGRSFKVFECDHLRPIFTSPRMGERIRAILCIGYVTLTAMKRNILAWHRHTELGRFCGHTSTPTILCNVGTKVLLSASDAEVLVWQLSDIGIQPEDVAEHKSCVVRPSSRLALTAGFGHCTAACHPPTYLHKVLIGSSTGHLELWNLRSLARVHSFKAHRVEGKEPGAISCLCEAPNVLDTVAVGFASGRICLLNIKEDRLIMEFEQTQGCVTAMAFRAGNNAPAHLVSGTPTGSIVIWDLNKRRAHHTHESVHRGPIVSLTFLFDQPVLITGGRDNSIRAWLFETLDGIPKALRERTGCPGPPRRLCFYSDDNEKELMVYGSADGHGFVAKVSLALENHAVFSDKNIKKLPPRVRHVPPVIDMAFSNARHWDWPAMVTAHENTDVAFVWSAAGIALSPWCLSVPPGHEDDGVPVTAVAVSPCGNYCVLGYENGSLHHFNVQSQLHRGPYPKPLEGKAAVPLRAHCGRVSGVTITVAGCVASMASHPKDCRLRLWRLLTHESMGEIPLDGTASCLHLRTRGALAAISRDNGALQVVDLLGQRVVRTFACRVPAVDAAFSSDSRWLAAALRDGGLRIFDLPAARCVDSFAFAQPAACVTFSPNNAFLLTAHAKGQAVQMWANKFLFDPSFSAPLLNAEPVAPILVDEPLGDGERGGSDAEAERPSRNAAKVETEAERKAREESAKPLAPELLTLSDAPPQKWQATLHLDLVKERNRAVEAPKPLPNAPFFLPTAHEGVKPRFAPLLQDPEEEANPLGRSRILEGDRRPLEGTEFQVRLRKGDHEGALTFLRSQTSSGVHLALEELGSLAGGDAEELGRVLEFFLHHLGRAHYADELQAYLSLFLQAHGEDIAGAPALRQLCVQLGKVQEGLWTKLSGQCQKARCFLGILTQTQSQW